MRRDGPSGTLRSAMAQRSAATDRSLGASRRTSALVASRGSRRVAPARTARGAHCARRDAPRPPSAPPGSPRPHRSHLPDPSRSPSSGHRHSPGPSGSPSRNHAYTAKAFRKPRRGQRHSPQAFRKPLGCSHVSIQAFRKPPRGPRHCPEGFRKPPPRSPRTTGQSILPFDGTNRATAPEQ